MLRNNNRYRRIFRNRKTVFPVIHVDTLEQAQRNTQIAREMGADGVFLINHSIPDDVLQDIHSRIIDRHPDWWIGLNCLGLSPDQAFCAISSKVSGLWVDQAGIEEGQLEQPYAEHVRNLSETRAPDCIYFGGVAFKYQRPVCDLEAACRIAMHYMDVVTTSGPGTGFAVDLDKIRQMKQALGDIPLAIASGITPENVSDYLPVADSFLAATGISTSFLELDPYRVQALVDRIHSYTD